MNGNSRDTITLHYFIVERPQPPVASFEGLILNYKQMSQEQKEVAEGTVRELFEEEEYYALRDYLRDEKSEDLRTGMLVTPVNALKPGNELGLGLSRPFGARKDGEEGGFYRLCDEPGYNLPFAVWGYYRPAQS